MSCAVAKAFAGGGAPCCARPVAAKSNRSKPAANGRFIGDSFSSARFSALAPKSGHHGARRLQRSYAYWPAFQLLNPVAECPDETCRLSGTGHLLAALKWTPGDEPWP